MTVRPAAPGYTIPVPARLAAALEQLGRIVVGKHTPLKLALACLLARGHLLIEDIPGVGKSTLAQALASTLGLHYARIQFTSDLLPADVLGVSIFDPSAHSFRFHSGPIFHSVVLADEINRAPPKTQSALLEAMEERQVSADGEPRPLRAPGRCSPGGRWCCLKTCRPCSLRSQVSVSPAAPAQAVRTRKRCYARYRCRSLGEPFDFAQDRLREPRERYGPLSRASRCALR